MFVFGVAVDWVEKVHPLGQLGGKQKKRKDMRASNENNISWGPNTGGWASVKKMPGGMMQHPPPPEAGFLGGELLASC